MSHPSPYGVVTTAFSEASNTLRSESGTSTADRLSDRECADLLKALSAKLPFRVVLEVHEDEADASRSYEGAKDGGGVNGEGEHPGSPIIAQKEGLVVRYWAPTLIAEDIVRRGVRWLQARSPSDVQSLIDQYEHSITRKRERIARLQARVAEGRASAGAQLRAEESERVSLEAKLRLIEYFAYGPADYHLEGVSVCGYPATCPGAHLCVTKWGCSQRAGREQEPHALICRSFGWAMEEWETAVTVRQWVSEVETGLDFPEPVNLRVDSDERRMLIHRLLYDGDRRRGKEDIRTVLAKMLNLGHDAVRKRWDKIADSPAVAAVSIEPYYPERSGKRERETHDLLYAMFAVVTTLRERLPQPSS